MNSKVVGLIEIKLNVEPYPNTNLYYEFNENNLTKSEAFKDPSAASCSTKLNVYY